MVASRLGFEIACAAKLKIGQFALLTDNRGLVPLDDLLKLVQLSPCSMKILVERSDLNSPRLAVKNSA